MRLNWDLSDAFLMFRLRLWVLQGKPIEVKCHPQHITSRVHAISINCDGVNLDHQAKVCVSDFSTVKLLPTLHSRLYFQKQVTMYSPHLRDGELSSTSLSREHDCIFTLCGCSTTDFPSSLLIDFEVFPFISTFKAMPHEYSLQLSLNPSNYFLQKKTFPS